MNPESRELVNEERKAWTGRIRLVELLKHLGVSSTTWHRKPNPHPKPRGRPRKPLDPMRAEPIRKLCETYPFWGCKRIAVIARRDIDCSCTDREVHRIMKQQFPIFESIARV